MAFNPPLALIIKLWWSFFKHLPQKILKIKTLKMMDLCLQMGMFYKIKQFKIPHPTLPLSIYL